METVKVTGNGAGNTAIQSKLRQKLSKVKSIPKSGRTFRILLKTLCAKFGAAYVQVINEPIEIQAKVNYKTTWTYTHIRILEDAGKILILNGNQFRNKIDVDVYHRADIEKKCKWVTYLTIAFAKYRYELSQG